MSELLSPHISDTCSCPAGASTPSSGLLPIAVHDYIAKLNTALQLLDAESVVRLGTCLRCAWQFDRQIFLCGNGGSAANAMHLANDLLYGAGRRCKKGLRASALAANPSILTCLANDISYDDIYSEQLRTLACPDDVLIVFSGSGNSQNVVNALRVAAEIGMQTAAILGFDGGKCLDICDIPLHIPLHDMQISEDIQVIVGHMLMRMLLEAGRD